jgi:hypothetical protein
MLALLRIMLALLIPARRASNTFRGSRV